MKRMFPLDDLSEASVSTVKLTKAQVHQVAQAVMHAVGNIFEDDWDNGYHPELEGLDVEAVRALVAKWMRKLPGNGWHRNFDPR